MVWFPLLVIDRCHTAHPRLWGVGTEPAISHGPLYVQACILDRVVGDDKPVYVVPAWPILFHSPASFRWLVQVEFLAPIRQRDRHSVGDGGLWAVLVQTHSVSFGGLVGWWLVVRCRESNPSEPFSAGVG